MGARLNLNVASWLGNRELDVIVEHEPFARKMEDMFLHDLRNATEVVLQRDPCSRARRALPPSRPGDERRRQRGSSCGGSGSRRQHGYRGCRQHARPGVGGKANIAPIAGAMLAAIAALAFKYPRGIAYPIGVFAAWFAAAILYRGGIELYRNRQSGP